MKRFALRTYRMQQWSATATSLATRGLRGNGREANLQEKSYE